MDEKISLILLLIFVSCLTSCDKSYTIDDDFFIENNHIMLSSINGFVQTDNGIFLYGNSDYFNHYGRVITKSDFYGLLKLNNAAKIDTNFRNPFSYPVSISNIVKLYNGKYLVFYKKLLGTTNNSIMLMDQYGNLEKIVFELSEILNKSVNQELIVFKAAAIDSLGNTYFSVNSQSSEQPSLLIKLTPSFNLDLEFQNQILDKFNIQEINQIQIQSDNMIIFGGRFVFKSNLNNYQNLCRIDIDGKIDDVFCQNLPIFEKNDYNRVYAISFIDTSIYIGGNFTINLNKNKISNLVRINSNGSIHFQQPNKNNIFLCKDDEPYFKKTTILSISEFDDSLMFVSGIFNHVNKRRTSIPISIIRKDGNKNDSKFYSQNIIFYINSVYIRNKDTIYIFGNTIIKDYSILPIGRLIKK